MSGRVVPLGELCDMDRRGVRPDDPLASHLPFVGVENVDSGTGFLNFDTKSRTGNRRSASFRFDSRHVLYAKLRPYLNKVATPGFAGRCSTELVPLLPRAGVDRAFLAWLLRRGETVAFVMASATGARMPRADMKVLLSMPVSFPPLDTQRRIAGLLDRAARIQRLRARAAARLRAFAPALFVKMFGDPEENPMGWPIVRLRDIAAVLAGDPAPQEPRAFGVRGPLFVRMQDVGRYHVNPALSASKDRLDPVWLSENNLRLFPKGSVLIPKSGASVNLNHRAMLATEAHVVSHLAVLIPDRSRICPDYLFWWSVHYDPRKKVQTTSLPSLKLATLKETDIPIPPLSKQQNFVKFLNLNRMNHSAKRVSKSASNLTESLMVHLLGDST